MRSFFKISICKIYFLAFFVLQGCKPDSATEFIDNVKKSASSVTEELLTYNYSEFYYSLKNAYLTAHRNRYPESQEIVISTNRDGQNYAYNGIIKECETIKCNIKESIIKRNTIFPENTTAYFKIEIPANVSQQFYDSILKYGKITYNKSSNDSFIGKDLDYYNNELNSLQLAKQQLEETLSKKEPFTPERIENLIKTAESVNNKILYLQNDIKYLNDVLDKKLIRINIQKEHNSTINKVKSNLQNIMYIISDYSHIIILIILIIIIIKVLKMIKILFVTGIKSLKSKKKLVPAKTNEPHL